MSRALSETEIARIFGSEGEDAVSSSYFIPQLGTWKQVVNTPLQFYLPKSTTTTDDNLDGLSYFYLFLQNNSWGCMASTYRMWNKVVSYHDVFHDIFKHVRAFGCKNVGEQHIRNGHSWQNTGDGASFGTTHPAKLDLNDGLTYEKRWSMRQIGVYQKYNHLNARSIWILTSASDMPKKALEVAKASNEEDARFSLRGPSIFHTVLIETATSEWREYLESLDTQLQNMDEKACFSRLGRTHYADYVVTFADCQQLQKVCKKLILARNVLENSIRLIAGLQRRFNRMQELTKETNYYHVCDELNGSMEELSSHKLTVESSLEYLYSTAHLVRQLEKILEFRNDETRERNSIALREIASETRNENENMTKLARSSAQDSKLLKALTILATMYLPATLFATIFSSNLVELRVTDENEKQAHLKLSGDFWIYALLTLGVSILTSALMLWLNRHWVRLEKRIPAMGIQQAHSSAASAA